jgi:hypothetical protein
MDTARFDRWTQDLSIAVSRRQSLASLGFGLGALAGLLDLAEAKKRKKKKIKRNDFGCVNVGNFCKNAGHCCSGICSGKRGKKKCRAHDTGGCRAEHNPVTCGGSADVPCFTNAGALGQCAHTTGNAGYCQNSGNCLACTRDPDCVPFCGADAACIVCEGLCGPGGTACTGNGPEPCSFV